MIYFLQEESTRNIKIGYTGHDTPISRPQNQQTLDQEWADCLRDPDERSAIARHVLKEKAQVGQGGAA